MTFRLSDDECLVDVRKFRAGGIVLKAPNDCRESHFTFGKQMKIKRI